MTSMKQVTMDGRSDLIGQELSETRINGLNRLLKGAFEVLAAAVSIQGTCPEDAYLLIEVVARGYEFRAFELSLPLSGSKAREFINKELFDVFNGSTRDILTSLRSYFRSLADSCTFGQPIPA